jgi:DNA-binding transcriptional LysR family regulator
LRDKADLARAQFIAPTDGDTFVAMMNSVGVPLTSQHLGVSCSSYMALWELVKAGLGLGILDDRLGDADPSVRRALPGYVPLTFPVWLIAHRDLHHNRRIRMVYDFLAERLG